ncbi:LysR family transcriptional regulator [Rhodoplanes sp. TEM]|uniref:LysR family transcriptional regulator n=1 Tax=Rhodoplanes tepidamans TaxID=200616 RepID=A0ABT5JC81_RHOTP|nr:MULTISPECIES: LysR family transcriptional regulator [Rhodoplanes]MDC7787227.1 LysR family transcriptional regulator [Rhodoplanes tepidamans]MDC7986759.1 LysR family transcriptional regulator [Rhodoplanes sp. TEM]MDQ0357761.1 DNA-binding transcriptional LysR family regulator [Rhodoplanes tepidamans]
MPPAPPVSPKSSRPIRYDWNDIVFFLEVARQRNLVRAAAKLKVDHTTVSRRVRELERSLNCTLFRRSKSGFTLTETGLRLLQYAEGMENQANSIVEAVGVGEAEPAGAVRIASMEGIGSLYLTRCVADFNRLHPSIQIELITDSRLFDLSRREADVFVSFFRPSGKRLSVKKVGEFRISLFASRGYFAERPPPRSLKELDTHTFVDFIDEHVHIRENRWLSDILRPGHMGFRSTSLVAQYVAVSTGQGIGMLPSFVAAHNNDLRPVMPKLFTVRDIWLSVHEDLLHVARIRAVLSFLERRIRDDAGFLMGES